MLQSLKNWIVEKFLISYATYYAEIFRRKLREQPEDVQMLVDKLFNDPVMDVQQWGLEKLYGSSLETATAIDVLDKALDPINDDIEKPIMMIVRAFNPRSF